MGSKYPKPKDINFPEVGNRIEYNIEKCSEEQGARGKKHAIALSICGLKSGNILISYIVRDEANFDIKSFLSIHSVPDLKLVQKYEFDSEVNDIIYSVVYAIQLKNGNIFSICDKFYFFEGESIADGPKTTSEEVNSMSCNKIDASFDDPLDFIFKQNKITKKSRRYLCDFMIEPKEGIILYTCDTQQYNHEINLLDISNLENIETKGKKVYSWSDLNKKSSYEFDIIYQSEYYPENLYVIANGEGDASAHCLLLIFNSDNFCNKNSGSKKPVNSIEVSKKQNVFALLEYDKIFLLLDTINNGIYIINIEQNQKVALCNLKVEIDGRIMKRDEKVKKDIFKTLYRNMVKLKDGQVLTVDYSSFFVADIKGEKKVSPPLQNRVLATAKFVISGDYAIVLQPMTTELSTYKLYNN
jgi:hypothetical protein